MIEWNKDPKIVMEFAEFLVESEQITTPNELLEYFRHPDKYTEVWRLYQEEIRGVPPGSLEIGPACKFKPVSALVALVSPSSQCE